MTTDHPDSTPDAPHNYVRLVEQFVARHPERIVPGSFNHIEILHDDWCGVHDGRRCHCQPEIRWAADEEAPR